MNNKIKICKIDSSIEEEAECLVNEQRFVGFIAYASKEIEVGKEYDAEIDIFVNDGLYIEEQKGTKLKGLEHIENFSYILNGKLLDDDILDVKKRRKPLRLVPKHLRSLLVTRMMRLTISKSKCLKLEI